jgi:hypothetical protein
LSRPGVHRTRLHLLMTATERGKNSCQRLRVRLHHFEELRELAGLFSSRLALRLSWGLRGALLLILRWLIGLAGLSYTLTINHAATDRLTGT